MSFDELGLVALAIYVVGLVGVGELAHRRKRDRSPEDHFLGGRDLGFFVLFLTLYATAYSGNSLIGYPAKAYVAGYAFIMATGFMMAIVVVFHSLVPRLRPIAVAAGFVTPGDWIRYRFASPRSHDSSVAARGLLVGVGILMSLALLNFLLAQLTAMGTVTEQVTGGRIPFAAGVVGLAILILFYETRGGMRAVAWTDAAQGILMLVGLAALTAWLVGDVGGLAGLTQRVEAARPEAVAVPDASGCLGWMSTTILLGLASVLYPQAIQRIYAARSGRALRQSLAAMSFMPLATTFVVTLIGLAAIPRLTLVAGDSSDQVMPLLLAEWAASGAWGTTGAILVFLGALAAIMSTADSCLLSLGSMVARDLLGGAPTDPATTRRGKLIAGLLLVITIPLALQREMTLWRLLELKMELLIQCVPAFLIAIHWPKLRAAPTLVGLLAGTAFSVGLTLDGVLRLGGLHVGVVGLGLNAAIAIVGSVVTGPSGPAVPRHSELSISLEISST